MKTISLLADDAVLQEKSREEMAAYYTERLQELDRELNDYNLLQHPVQIQRICWKIKEIKANYKLLMQKK